jgi:hypothetical protein
MEFFILLIIGVFILNILVPRPGANDTSGAVYQSLRCPPHKWKWQEVKDPISGETIDKMVCERCGPLRSERRES